MSLSFIASAGRQPGHTTRYRPHVYTKPAVGHSLSAFAALFNPDDNRRYPRKTSRRAAFRSRRRIVRFQ